MRPMRRALVTGGTRGLGLATARALAAAGHELVATYAHDDEAARAAEADFAAAGLTYRAARCDVTSA